MDHLRDCYQTHRPRNVKERRAFLILETHHGDRVSKRKYLAKRNAASFRSGGWHASHKSTHSYEYLASDGEQYQMIKEVLARHSGPEVHALYMRVIFIHAAFSAVALFVG